MKIGLVSSTAPFVRGGGRFIVEWLASMLVETGHDVETIWIPSAEDPRDILRDMAVFRLVDIQNSFDRVITFRPPAHAIHHKHKIVWFIHHHRAFYDLWNTEYCGVPDTAYWRSVRGLLMNADRNALQEAKAVFSNSKVVANRLLHFNKINSEVLYPPVFSPERFHNEAWGDEIVCVCRVEPHKRQHLLIEAMKHVRTPVRLRLIGEATDKSYVLLLRSSIRLHGLSEKVALDIGWIDEEEKIRLLSTALAATYIPFDEDSYGYPTIEAAHARKGTVSVMDSGGVREFVNDGETGLLTSPDPEAIAGAFDRLWTDRQSARRFGNAAHDKISRMNITWENVLARLLS